MNPRVIQRPYVAALVACIERERSIAARQGAIDLWRPLHESTASKALLDAERDWQALRTSVRGTDAKAFVAESTRILCLLLRSLIWIVSIDHGRAPVTEAQRAMRVEDWLVGAWPVTQPAGAPDVLCWPCAATMSLPRLVASTQNAVLHVAWEICDRLDALGVVAPMLTIPYGGRGDGTH